MNEIGANIILINTPIGAGQFLTYEIRPSVIHILFTQNQPLLVDTAGQSMELPRQSSYLIYDQKHGYLFKLGTAVSSHVVALEIPIEALHRLMSKGVDELEFRHTGLFDKERYHKMGINSDQISSCLSSMVELNNPLMLQARKFELLSHYFTVSDVQHYKCPFLNLKDNVEKVRQAKQLLIEDLRNAPTIKELSRAVGLNEHHLKTGFKEIYGKPIHTFLKDHKMIEAKRLIEGRQYKVNEIADQMGYANVSHFIEAFKNKFGITPKKYELKLQH